MGKVLFMRKGNIHAAPSIIDTNTLLLIHGTEIADSSSYGLSLTNAGASITKKDGSINRSVLYFNGSGKINLPIGDYFNFGTGDFTIEWREYVPEAFSTAGNPFTFDTSPAHFLWYYSGSTIYLYFTKIFEGVNTGAVIDTIKTGQWVHRAFVRHGNKLYAFANGVLTWNGTLSGNAPYTAGYQMCVGGRSDVSQYFVGYMEEFRVSNVARWTENFTPPITPY